MTTLEVNPVVVVFVDCPNKLDNLLYSSYMSDAVRRNDPFNAVSNVPCWMLTRCYWSDEHCDCKAVATVHDLPSEQDFCERHFNMVQKARQ